MPEVLVEPSRAAGTARRAADALSRGVAWAATLPNACGLAAALLVAGSRGDAWTAAALLGIADRAAAPAVVGAAAGALMSQRYGSAALEDVAGAQALLGAGGWHGAAGVLLATWAIALALVSVCRHPAPAAVAGALGGLLVAGPAAGAGVADLALRMVALALGASAGWFLAPRTDRARRQPATATVIAAVGLVALYAATL